MKVLVYDTETTTRMKGNPFHPDNKLCLIGWNIYGETGYDIADIEYSGKPFGGALSRFQRDVATADRLVGFNLKYDIHWIRRYGVNYTDKRVWDCQLVHFLLTNQSVRYPSLNGVSEYYGLGSKLDVVADEYWSKGIDTPDIPYNVLSEYLTQDVMLTRKVYECQLLEVAKRSRAFQRLVQLANQDLLVLEEMEWNGMKYDIDQSIKEGDRLEERINEIEAELAEMAPYPEFNWGSGDHISLFLYGGTYSYNTREDYTFTYKSGKEAIKSRKVTKQIELPRLVTPLKRTELKKAGYWATNEDTLKSLRAKGKAKRAIELILERSGLEKLRGTYLHGLPAKFNEYGWDNKLIHGQLNQCVAATGRLSSSNPNMQNIAGDIKGLFITRY